MVCRVANSDPWLLSVDRLALIDLCKPSLNYRRAYADRLTAVLRRMKLRGAARFEPVSVVPPHLKGELVAREALRICSASTSSTPKEKTARRRFISMLSELSRLLLWLREQGVEDGVMESTAQYSQFSVARTGSHLTVFEGDARMTLQMPSGWCAD